MIFACIGSRETEENLIVLMEHLGTYLVQNGHTIRSGNAIGADQAYARGANSVDPTKVQLALPWLSYEKDAIVDGNEVIAQWPDYYKVLAKAHHPRFDFLKAGAKKLIIRNAGIIDGADRVFAHLNPAKSHGGGTAHGVAIAKALNIPVFEIISTTTLEECIEWTNGK